MCPCNGSRLVCDKVGNGAARLPPTTKIFRITVRLDIIDVLRVEFRLSILMGAAQLILANNTLNPPSTSGAQGRSCLFNTTIYHEVFLQ